MRLPRTGLKTVSKLRTINRVAGHPAPMKTGHEMRRGSGLRTGTGDAAMVRSPPSYLPSGPCCSSFCCSSFRWSPPLPSPARRLHTNPCRAARLRAPLDQGKPSRPHAGPGTVRCRSLSQRSWRTWRLHRYPARITDSAQHGRPACSCTRTTSLRCVWLARVCRPGWSMPPHDCIVSIREKRRCNGLSTRPSPASTLISSRTDCTP